ncbi:hypothetical protein P775_11360 [Puniceibacterium antarcticum]|uniref:Uncharacterized protein n=1 Tax=Puniceibacterium antarcticum TaxID=1206336 RepID=A0A2G8REU7_9RHOB|nr:hypothetical protein P775_11360 [Puniceibacterium antarcticum]
MAVRVKGAPKPVVVTGIEITLSTHDIAQAQGKTMMRPDSLRDDGTGKRLVLQAS